MRDLRQWSLFLDRDGVINQRLPNEYVTHYDNFIFCEGVLQATAFFARTFQHIVVVTNQQGIGKGLMTEADLAAIHNQMKADIENAGGRLDGIYACPHLAVEQSPLRKPNVGMAYLAKHDFPAIHFSHCFMVGDSYSDMVFGQRLGMVNVFIEGKEHEQSPDGLAHLRLPSLAAFATWVENNSIKY